MNSNTLTSKNIFATSNDPVTTQNTVKLFSTEKHHSPFFQKRDVCVENITRCSALWMSLDTDPGLQCDSSGWQRKISSIIFLKGVIRFRQSHAQGNLLYEFPSREHKSKHTLTQRDSLRA